MSANREPDSLSPEEKEFIHRMADLYAPPPMTPRQRTAFNRALEKRLSRNIRVSFFHPVTIAATACVAVLVWFTLQRQSGFLPDPSSEVAIITQQEEATADIEEATLLAYAYYNPEFYGEENTDDSEDDEQFLPDEYEALATVFAFPDA